MDYTIVGNYTLVDVIASHFESSSSTTTKQTLQARLETKVNSTAIVQTGITNGTMTINSTNETQESDNAMVQVIGGNPMIYETKRLNEWSKTIENDGNNNLTIICGDLEPIFKLTLNEQMEFHLKIVFYKTMKNTKELGKLRFTAKPKTPTECTVTVRDSLVSLQATYLESHPDGFIVKLTNLNGENYLYESRQEGIWLLKILDENHGENTLACLIINPTTNERLGLHISAYSGKKISQS